jgi:glycosyltransferase involved in cell wall biosynthesis
MRIAWDARVLGGPELRGIGTYSVSLLREMRVLRPSLEVLLLADEPLCEQARAVGYPVHVVGPSRGFRWRLWEQYGLPFHAVRLGASLIHSPANTAPRWSRVPRVVTVHDVIPYLPDVRGDVPTGRYWTRVVPAAVRTADAVITDSAASRQDIMRVFGVPSDRIVVVPLAPEAVEPPADTTARLDALGLADRPFVLVLAASARRKNLSGAVDTFSRIARAHPDVVLALIGVTPALAPAVAALLASHQIDSARVRTLGFVDEATRSALYSRAAVFLFLTLYEGFGLPILEAMRLGAPVVTSNRSSCPEVAGDAAVLVDPMDAERAADAVLGVLARDSTEREVWRRRGVARSDSFTWTETARKTLAVYDQVAG